jgi:hypothetical protein
MLTLTSHTPILTLVIISAVVIAGCGLFAWVYERRISDDQ